MRTAITLLALAVAVNVAVNEFSCVGPSPSKRDGRPLRPAIRADDRGERAAGADADGEEPPCPWDIRPDQAEATRVDQDAVRAALGAYCQGEGIEGGRLERVRFWPCSASRRRPPLVPTWRWELLDSDGSKAADVGSSYSLGLRHVHGRPLESL